MQILFNGRLHACSPGDTALAIHNGLIAAVGSDAEVLRLQAPGVDSIDLGGRYVLPGLTDSHLHLDIYGKSLTGLDCAVPTREACLESVKTRAQDTPAGHWILGHGWNQNQWSGGFGTFSELDAAAPNHPVFLTDISLHSAWVNSKALQQAGIVASTPDPAGGTIQRDANGKPTGILFEGAVELVEKNIPELTTAERKHNLLAAQQHLLRLGITSVHDFDGIRCFNALQELDQEGSLLLRVTKSLPVDWLTEAVAIGLRTDFGSQHLRVGSMKLFADGALGPQTAAMLDHYEGSRENFGKLLLTADEILDVGMQAAKSGLSLAVHAIGDRATQEALHGLVRLRAYENQHHLPELRHRIEHLQLLCPGDLEIASRYRIWASMQPVHLYMDMHTADRHWGKRARYAYAVGSLKSRQTCMVFGSDAPVENPNPAWGIHAAVTRSAQGSENSWYPEEKIALTDAIKAYTTEPSRLAGFQNKLGELRTSCLADLVVLDRDPFQMPPQELYTLKSLMVMVDGNWVCRTI